MGAETSTSVRRKDMRLRAKSALPRVGAASSFSKSVEVLFVETRQSSGGSRDFGAADPKQRSSFRKKKVKKNVAVRRTNSAEHLYDSADVSGRQNKPNNRARLPIPDEVHAGLYAMVTTKPVDNTSCNEPTNDSLDDLGASATTGLAGGDKNKSLSPGRNSLYEREGLVVTCLDKKLGSHDAEKVDESFVSSANIEHTVSSEGSVYAIVQSRPKSRKSQSSASSDDTGRVSADLKQNPDETPLQPPKKPPRTPPIGRKPPPYQPKSEDSTSPKTPVSPDSDPLSIDRPPSAGSGPPSFPPPPPPLSKSATPEPVPIDDPTYAVVKAVKKPNAKKPQVSAPAPKQPERKLSRDEIPSENGYSLVSDEHTDGGTTKDSEPLTPNLIHIDDALATDSLRDQRPPHLYSTIQEDEQVESSTVSVRMVSHGYATVVDKGKLNGQSSKKKKMPRLPPRTKPPPPPPNAFKRGAPAAHKPLGHMVSTPPVGAHALSPEPESADRTFNARSSTFSQAENAEPKFLFSQKLCHSLIAVGDSPEVVTPPHSVPPTVPVSMMLDEDSDADIMYSTEWESSTDEEEKEERTRTSVHRPKTYYIAREVLTTERTFVKGLTLLDKDFRQAVRSANNAHDKPVIGDDALKLILGNVSSLLSLNSDMLKDLEDRMSRWDDDPRIGDILKIRAPYFKIYTEYISKFDKALKALDEWTKKSPQFAAVVHEIEAQAKCASIPIAGYMLDIVQRITRYKMLMADYVKHLPEDSTDREDSERALEAISSTATHVNETIRQMDNFRKVVEVRKRLIGDSGDTLITPYRKLLKEGELLKFSRKEKQPRMFFLFNDILIYASSIPPANTTYKVIKRIPLEGMLVEPLDDPEMKYGFQIVSTCKSFRLEASNKEERTQWLTAFEAAIKEQAERMKNREKVRQILAADRGETDGTDSLPLGHLAPPWLPDSAVSMCQLCSVHFTVTRRRHHCRGCGMIFCSDCSNYYAPLKYMNSKTERVCQSCFEKIDSNEDGSDRSPTKRPGRLLKGFTKMVSMPSVLREVKARDRSAQISGYLNSHTSKSKRWKKRWYVVYNLVLYEFERHEDVSAKRSITLPSYQVISPVPRHEDPLVFVLKHDGTGKQYFKVENEQQLVRWIEVLSKAVRGEIGEEDEDETAAAALLVSPDESVSPNSFDSQEPDSSSST